MAKVSIVIATYRREKELKRALNSLVNQTHEDIEIVIVDDNAREDYNTKVSEIVQEFRDENPGISLKFIPNEINKGSAETRNIGIRAAEGVYITFLDDDDIYLPEKVKKQ